jgi:hypothetical protein
VTNTELAKPIPDDLVYAHEGVPDQPIAAVRAKPCE